MNEPKLLKHVAPLRQGEFIHSSMSTSQRLLLKPALQIQVNDPIEFKQVAPFSHGEVRHSSISDSQSGPVNPSAHEQMKRAIVV